MSTSHTLGTRETRESLAWKTLTNYHLLRKKCEIHLIRNSTSNRNVNVYNHTQFVNSCILFVTALMCKKKPSLFLLISCFISPIPSGMGDYEHLTPVTMPSSSPQMHHNEVFPSSLTMNMKNPSCRQAEGYSWPVCHHYPGANTLLPFTYNRTQCWNPQGTDFSLVPCPTNEGLRLTHHQDMVYELI